MGFVIYDSDESVLGHYFDVVLIQGNRKRTVDLHVTTKRVIYIYNAVVYTVWYPDVLSCRIERRAFYLLKGLAFRLRSGGSLIFFAPAALEINQKVSSCLSEVMNTSLPGIARIVGDQRGESRQVIELGEFTADLKTLKSKVDEISQYSTRFVPILEPINCTLTQILDVVMGRGEDLLEEDVVDKPLAEVIEYILDRAIKDVGAVLLIDLYSIVNKVARQVKPSELLDLLRNPPKGFSLVDLSIDSSKNVFAIVRNDYDKFLFKTINSIEEFKYGITLHHYSSILDISPFLAEYQLACAESNGFIVRDVSMEGIKYYGNPGSQHPPGWREAGSFLGSYDKDMVLFNS